MNDTFEVKCDPNVVGEFITDERDEDATAQYIFEVGIATLRQRAKSQVKQLARSKAARKALAYVEAQGIKL